MDRLVLTIYLLLILKGLEALNYNNCENLEKTPSSVDKIVLSPVVIKAKIKSRFETLDFTQVNIKITKVFKHGLSNFGAGVLKKGQYLRQGY
jgi:hypothetical protein